MASTDTNYSTDNPEVAMIYAALVIARSFPAPNGIKDTLAQFEKAHAAIRAAHEKKD